MFVETRLVSRELLAIYRRMNSQSPLPGRAIRPAPNLASVPGRIQAQIAESHSKATGAAR
jgi:hypothetical protein